MQLIYYICDRLQFNCNKYTYNMQIPSNILKEIKRLIKVDGIVKTCDGSGINYRTLNRAIKIRICKDTVFEKMKAYISAREVEVSKMIEQDQD